MNRRTNKISGWVNFPVADEKWTSTNEGGLFVILVVADERKINWVQCCCNYIYVLLGEPFISDDKIRNTIKIKKGKEERLGEIHFPHSDDDICNYRLSKYLSRIF